MVTSNFILSASLPFSRNIFVLLILTALLFSCREDDTTKADDKEYNCINTNHSGYTTIVHKGAFLSLPDSSTQIYHQDGPHLTTKYQRPCHAINVFIPLVDLMMKNGPTEFCVGTHILGFDYYSKEMLDTPLVTAGCPVIFDYRLGHRGLGNSSQHLRPILYLTYTSAAKEFRDSVNFSKKRYRKLGDLIEKPMSRQERALKRAREMV